MQDFEAAITLGTQCQVTPKKTQQYILQDQKK